MHKMAHEDGEVGTSRAAAKAGISMALSTYATASVEEVIAQGQGNPYAFQMSLYNNREATEKLLRRAEGRSKSSQSSIWRLVSAFNLPAPQQPAAKPFCLPWMHLSLVGG